MKLMKILFLTLVFLVSLLPLVMADGWHLSDYQLHMEEPNQKAVISWDGNTETMILSAAVKSDDIANFAWIIPIQSSSKPTVTEGNISIFNDLVAYFQPKYDYREGTLAPGGVEVIEYKEIGIYDITILKANNSDDLLNWLNNNGYKVPEEAKSILNNYVAKGDYYFVTNKIDLKNRFSQQIEEIDEIVNNRKQQYKNICNEITEIFYTLGIEDSIYHFDYKKDTNWDSREDFCYLGQRYSDEKKGALDILSKYLNDQLQKEFQSRDIEPRINIDLGNGLSIEGEMSITAYLDYPTDELSYWYWEIGHDFWILKDGNKLESFNMNSFGLKDKNSGIRNPQDMISDINKGYVKLDKQDENIIIEFFSLKGQPYNNFINELNKRYQVVETKIEPIVIDMRESFGTKLEDIQNYDHDLFEYKDGQLAKVSGVFYGTLDDVKDAQKKYGELYYTLNDLKRGLGTPLKFKFQPHKPYYPLEISNLNIGNTLIEVYVITNNPVEDENNILKVDKSKEITLDLREKLKSHIDVKEAKYLTRLSYEGNLNNLTNDAVFTKMAPFSKKPNIFITIYQRISNFFRMIIGK